MKYRGFIISLIIVVSIFGFILFEFFIDDNGFFYHQRHGSVVYSQKQLTKLEKRITRLSNDLNQQQLAYRSLQSEVSRLKTLQKMNVSYQTKTDSGASAAQFKQDQATPLVDKNDIREMVLSVLEETIAQQTEILKKQQSEQEELKKVAFADPAQVQQFGIQKIAEKLQLSEQQKLSYQRLIEAYSKLHQESNQQIAMDFVGENPEDIQAQITEKLAQEEDLTQQLEEDFLSVLNADQEKRYRELPENERKILGNRLFVQSDF